MKKKGVIVILIDQPKHLTTNQNKKNSNQIVLKNMMGVVIQQSGDFLFKKQ